MNRRSISHGTAPVRLDQVILPSAIMSRSRPSQSRRSSIAPQSRNLHGTRDTQPARRSVQPQGLRRQLYGKPNDLSSSVVSGVAELGESVLESSENVPVPPNPEMDTDLGNVNVTSHVRSSVKSLGNVNVTSHVRSSVKSSNSHQTEKKSNLESSMKLNRSKLCQPKIFSNRKQVSDSGLNSTQTFEQEEIAALTSTPCVKAGRIAVAAGVSKTSCGTECAALVEQMKLLAVEQRNAVQVMKLSFQKMNALMNKQEELISEGYKLFQDLSNFVRASTHADSVQNQEVSSAANVTECGENSTVTMKAHENSVELQKLHQFICDKEVSIHGKESQTEDKENEFLSKPVQRSLAVYVDLKSQMNCLKTPTLNRSLQLQSMTAGTPRTLLSNTVQNQLENLFEVSETDD